MALATDVLGRTERDCHVKPDNLASGAPPSNPTVLPTPPVVQVAAHPSCSRLPLGIITGDFWFAHCERARQEKRRAWRSRSSVAVPNNFVGFSFPSYLRAFQTPGILDQEWVDCAAQTPSTLGVLNYPRLTSCWSMGLCSLKSTKGPGDETTAGWAAEFETLVCTTEGWGLTGSNYF